MLTELKTGPAGAGATLEISFPRLRALMARFSARTPSGPFGRWDLVAIVETQGGWEKAMGGIGNGKAPKS